MVDRCWYDTGEYRKITEEPSPWIISETDEDGNELIARGYCQNNEVFDYQSELYCQIGAEKTERWKRNAWKLWPKISLAH